MRRPVVLADGRHDARLACAGMGWVITAARAITEALVTAAALTITKVKRPVGR